jgi:AcrR family transcriptional regulator
MSKSSASKVAQHGRPEVAPLGRRERNRIDKLNRIRSAARDLFVRLGYDRATTARIAEEADVSMSTIFFYAQDKRDLLFFLFNDWFNATLDEMEATFEGDRPVIASLLKLFRPLYEHHTAEPNLARATLRELNFYSEGKQAQKFYRNTERTLALIGRIIEAGQASGEVAPEIDRKIAAEIVFAVYQAEIRRYLAGAADNVDRGLQKLRAALNMLMTGLASGAGDRKAISPKSNVVRVKDGRRSGAKIGVK